MYQSPVPGLGQMRNKGKHLLQWGWYRLPREVVDAPFLETFRAKLEEL